jgi:hypothetical protein
MKVSDFEDKLKTVSDTKLVQMLASSRRDGPEVAVKLILAEGGRRGLAGMGDEPEKDAVPPAPLAPPEVSAEESGSGDAAAMDQPAGEGDGSEPVPAKAAWLTEENDKSGMPTLVKVLLYVVALGAIAFSALKFIHRG